MRHGRLHGHVRAVGLGRGERARRVGTAGAGGRRHRPDRGRRPDRVGAGRRADRGGWLRRAGSGGHGPAGGRQDLRTSTAAPGRGAGAAADRSAHGHDGAHPGVEDALVLCTPLAGTTSRAPCPARHRVPMSPKPTGRAGGLDAAGALLTAWLNGGMTPLAEVVTSVKVCTMPPVDQVQRVSDLMLSLRLLIHQAGLPPGESARRST